MIINSRISDPTIYNEFNHIIKRDFNYTFNEETLSDNIKQFHDSIQKFLTSEKSHSNYIKENAKKLSDIILADTILYTYSVLLNERSDSYLYSDIKKEYYNDYATSFLDHKQIKKFRESTYGASFILDTEYDKSTIKAMYRFCDPKLLHYFFQLDNPYYQKVTFENLKTFFKNIYKYIDKNCDSLQPKEIAKRYIVENMFNTNIFLNCILSLDKMGLTLDDSLTNDIISNYDYLNFLNCPELSAELINHFDYSEILKSAKEIVEGKDEDTSIKDTLFINHLELMKKSECFFTSRCLTSILKTFDEFSNIINTIDTLDNISINHLHDLLCQKKLHESNDYIASCTNRIKNSFIGKTELISNLIKRQCESIDYDVACDFTVSPFAYIIPITRIAFYNYILSIDSNFTELEDYINNNKTFFKFYCNKYPDYQSSLDNDTCTESKSSNKKKQKLYKHVIEYFYQENNPSSFDILDEITNDKASSSSVALEEVKNAFYFKKLKL